MAVDLAQREEIGYLWRLPCPPPLFFFLQEFTSENEIRRVCLSGLLTHLAQLSDQFNIPFHDMIPLAQIV